MTAARFRVADALVPDAHAQVWVEAPGSTATLVAVRREDDGPAGPVVRLPREWLTTAGAP